MSCHLHGYSPSSELGHKRHTHTAVSTVFVGQCTQTHTIHPLSKSPSTSPRSAFSSPVWVSGAKVQSAGSGSPGTLAASRYLLEAVWRCTGRQPRSRLKDPPMAPEGETSQHPDTSWEEIRKVFRGINTETKIHSKKSPFPGGPASRWQDWLRTSCCPPSLDSTCGSGGHKSAWPGSGLEPHWGVSESLAAAWIGHRCSSDPQTAGHELPCSRPGRPTARWPSSALLDLPGNRKGGRGNQKWKCVKAHRDRWITRKQMWDNQERKAVGKKKGPHQHLLFTMFTVWLASCTIALTFSVDTWVWL